MNIALADKDGISKGSRSGSSYGWVWGPHPPYSAQDVHLALCLGSTPGGAPETVQGAGNPTLACAKPVL